MVATTPETLKEQVIALFQQDEVPEALGWFDLLPPHAQRLCVLELSDALKRALVTGRFDDLATAMEEWEATAEVYASPELLEALARSGGEGEYVPLSDLISSVNE